MVALNLLLIVALSSSGLANFAGDPISYYIGASVTNTFDSTASQSSLLDVCTNYLSAIQDTATSTTTSTAFNLADARNVCGDCTSLSLSRVDSCCAMSDSADWASCFDSAARGKAQATSAGSSGAKTTPASNPATATGGTGLSASASATKTSSGSKLRMVSPVHYVCPCIRTILTGLSHLGRYVVSSTYCPGLCWVGLDIKGSR
jgi:hypothetical protein